MRIDINCDAGESFGAYVIGNDEALLPHVTSVNIACGFHAGDYNVMAKTVQLAKTSGTAVGAHPGFQDLAGFGRRLIESDSQDIYHSIVYQIGALQAFCTVHQIPVQHVKPHGALYNHAAVNQEAAEAVAAAVKDTDSSLLLFGLAGSRLIEAGKKAGLQVVQEVFADRTYQPDGTLTPRTAPNAHITKTADAVAQVLQMVRTGEVTCADGSRSRLQADSVCIHGDGVHAVDFAETLRKELEAAGVQIQAAGDAR